jgi:hypothetical protein
MALQYRQGLSRRDAASRSQMVIFSFPAQIFEILSLKKDRRLTPLSRPKVRRRDSASHIQFTILGFAAGVYYFNPFRKGRDASLMEQAISK